MPCTVVNGPKKPHRGQRNDGPGNRNSKALVRLMPCTTFRIIGDIGALKIVTTGESSLATNVVPVTFL